MGENSFDLEKNWKNWKIGDPVGYIRKDIPIINKPIYKGKRYEILVPDTFDIQERASLAINVLTRARDPEADFEIYFGVDINRNPPYMIHHLGDECDVKFLESLPLMRLVSGNIDNIEVENQLQEVLLRNLGDDGIYYYPLRGRPWALLGPWLTMSGGSEQKAKKSENIIIPDMAGRILSAMMNFSLISNEKFWKNTAKKLVNGLLNLAIDCNEYAFFAPSACILEKDCNEDFAEYDPNSGAMGAWVAKGLIDTYLETGYEPAINFARKLLNHILTKLCFIETDGSFGPKKKLKKSYPSNLLDDLKGKINIEYVMEYLGSKYFHFHTHTYVILAMAEYALATEDQNMLELSCRGFEYGKLSGNSLIGYFPEMLGRPNFETSETCEIADMIAIGLKLSSAGSGDYWDDVDCWIRNMFAEAQLTNDKAAYLKAYVSSLPVTPINFEELNAQGIKTPIYGTTDSVLERNIGAFAGWPEPNNWGTQIMHCCTGNGTRTIFYIWKNIICYSNGKLKVNLLLNRASDWADIDSHIPYKGQVDIKVKSPLELSVRIPKWVKLSEIICSVSGKERNICFEGRYAIIGYVKPGDIVNLSFPIFEISEKSWIEKHLYKLDIKGNTVVSIHPSGNICPLFNRPHYRNNDTRWRKIERFIPDILKY